MDQRDALQKEFLRVTQLIGSTRHELLRMIQRGLPRENPDVVDLTQRYHDLLDEQKRLRAQLTSQQTVWPPSSE